MAPVAGGEGGRARGRREDREIEERMGRGWGDRGEERRGEERRGWGEDGERMGR